MTPTDAQILEIMPQYLGAAGVMVGGYRADALRFARAVLSLHPAPSAALAAPVASPEPVYHCVGYIESFGTQIHDRPTGERSTPVYVLAQAQTAPIAPSPPTTPPAAEPDALTDARWRASKYGQEAAKLADDYLALTSYCGALKSQLDAYEASTAQGLSDAEINAIWSGGDRPQHGTRLSPWGMNRIRAILEATKETK